MAGVNAGDVLRVTPELKLSRGQVHENVFYFRNDGLGTATEGQAEADISQFLDDFYGNFQGRLSSATEFVQIHYFNVTQNAPMSVDTWPSMVNGGDGGQTLPAGASAILGLPTGVLRVRGRKYFGGFTESDNIGDQISSGLAGDILAASVDLIGSFLGASLTAWLPGVLDQSGAFWAFTEAALSLLWASQRRRRFGTGQ